MDHQRAYWDRVADQKTFTHPLDRAWLKKFVEKDARILDFGCGYGRVIGELTAFGYKNAVGIDSSRLMIERARRDFPESSFGSAEDFWASDVVESFDLILILAVLTCIPNGQEQIDLIVRMRGLLQPGGLLYLSDMPLQSDARNLARYIEGQRRFGVHGVFETDHGAIVRHHDPRWFDALLIGFEKIATRRVSIGAMNGHAAKAVQVLARRPIDKYP